MNAFLALVIVISVIWAVLVQRASGRRRRPAGARPPGLAYVFFLVGDDGDPRVREAADALEAAPGPERLVLVTGAPLRGIAAALNDTYLRLTDSDLLSGRSIDGIVVGVLDPGDRLGHHALFDVGDAFADPEVGAVVPGFRAANASESVLARLQDLDLVAFSEVDQAARPRLATGDGRPTGYFVRLTALMSQHPKPWPVEGTTGLAQALAAGGWRTEACPSARLSRPVETRLGALVGRRRDALTGGPGDAAPAPGTLVAASLLLGVVVAGLIVLVAAGPGDALEALTTSGGLLLVAWYTLVFSTAWVYGYRYWLADDRTTLPRAIALAHGATLTALLWIPAGVSWVWRRMMRQGAANDGALDDVRQEGLGQSA